LEVGNAVWQGDCYTSASLRNRFLRDVKAVDHGDIIAVIYYRLIEFGEGVSEGES
jgi:hypothetical protein